MLFFIELKSASLISRLGEDVAWRIEEDVVWSSMRYILQCYYLCKMISLAQQAFSFEAGNYVYGGVHMYVKLHHGAQRTVRINKISENFCMLSRLPFTSFRQPLSLEVGLIYSPSQDR